MTIEGEEETSVVLPHGGGGTPSRQIQYNNRSGVFRKSWRLNSETFETQKKTEAQIAGLHRRLPRHFNAGSKDGIVQYYRKQNKLVENFQEIENLLDRDGRPMQKNEDESRAEDIKLAKRAWREQFALRISFWANVALLVIKVFAAYSSGSLSIITGRWTPSWTSSAVSSCGRRRSPCGSRTSTCSPRANRECNRWASSSSRASWALSDSRFSSRVQQLVGPDHTHHLEDIYGVIGVMCTVILVKFGLYLYCRRSTSQAVQTYAQDHRNDVATNTIGPISAMLGDRLLFWIDPLGAILLAAYIIYNWAETALENIKSMVGMSAPPEFLTQLTYLAWNHHPEIVCIDTVRAYTFGPNFFVEVDVVLPEEMPLRQAHDIGESLQNTIEEMGEVERAFVHIDFETAHYPEHGEAERMMRKRRARERAAEAAENRNPPGTRIGTGTGTGTGTSIGSAT